MNTVTTDRPAPASRGLVAVSSSGVAAAAPRFIYTNRHGVNTRPVVTVNASVGAVAASPGRRFIHLKVSKP